MNPPKTPTPPQTSAVAATSAPPYTDPDDGEEQVMTGASGDGSRLPREAARLGGSPSGGPWRGSPPESLTRGEKILVAMLAAVLGTAAAGYFSLNATMNANSAAVNANFTAVNANFTAVNANFTAVNGHLLSLQEQIGRLDARIARMEVLLESGLTPVAPRSSPGGKPEPPPGS